VVLGGGAGVLAIWLIDPSSLSRIVRRPDQSSLRSRRRRNTAVVTGPRAAVQVVDAAAAPAPRSAPAPGPEAIPLPAPQPGPVRQRTRGDVPAAFTAVEGTYHDVAVAPLWRKGLSLALLLAVLAGTGVALAAVTGAAIAVGAEVVDGAIG
jgi:hypothetical protein